MLASLSVVTLLDPGLSSGRLLDMVEAGYGDEGKGEGDEGRVKVVGIGEGDEGRGNVVGTGQGGGEQ